MLVHAAAPLFDSKMAGPHTRCFLQPCIPVVEKLFAVVCLVIGWVSVTVGGGGVVAVTTASQQEMNECLADKALKHSDTCMY